MRVAALGIGEVEKVSPDQRLHAQFWTLVKFARNKVTVWHTVEMVS